MSGFCGAILAAGHGERLRSGGVAVPKPLVELCGQPLLARQAAALLAAGAERAVAIVNSETAAIIRERAIAMPEGLEITVRDTANSMETLLALGELLEPGLFLLATVDAVFAPGEMERFLVRARASLANSAIPSDGALGLIRWRGDKRPLFARVDEDGRIEALGDERSVLVTAGLYFLSTRIFDFADEARQSGLSAMRHLLALLLKRGVRLQGVEMGVAIDVDEVADLAAARAMLKRTTPGANSLSRQR